MAIKTTQLTLKALREDGWIAEVVEHWNAHTRRRHDFLNFADILAIKGDDTLAVQATSTGNINSRVKKILAEPKAKAWLEGERRFISVVGFKKYKRAVNRKFIRPTWRAIELDEFKPVLTASGGYRVQAMIEQMEQAKEGEA